MTTAPIELGVPVRSVNWVRLHAAQKRTGDSVLPGTARREIVWGTTREDTDNPIYAPGTSIGRRFFFARSHRLRCIDLPG